MSDRFICEVKVTKVQYAGDHDRETLITAASGEADKPEYAFERAVERARDMLESVTGESVAVTMAGEK